MTNLLATTPITAKAMQSLIIEVNRQKELKRTYRQRYKDLQMVTTTTATPPVTSQPLYKCNEHQNKCKFFNIETFLESRKENIREKGRTPNQWIRERNVLLFQHQALWLQLQLAPLPI